MTTNDSSQRPTVRPAPVLQVPRPTPGIPDRHLPAPPAPKPDPESTPHAAPMPRQEAVPASVSPDIDRAIGKTARGLWARVWPVLLTGTAGTLVAGYLEAKAALVRVDALTAENLAQKAAIEKLQTQVTQLEVREQARSAYEPEFQAWLTAVLERTQGVRIKRPENAQALPEIKTETPIKRGRVPAAPVTTVKTEPPSPP